MREIDSREKALTIAEAAAEKKAERPLLLDVFDITTLADYFFICSGGGERHVKAVADEIDYRLSAEGVYPVRVEGLSGGRWVLMDYGDVVAHIFDRDAREHYDLDGLWGDAQVVDL